MTAPIPAISPLTRRETECLFWASKGKTSWEIGNIVGCSERTANYHIANACLKMDVHGRQAAIALALVAGYLPDTPKPMAHQVAEVTSRLEAA